MADAPLAIAVLGAGNIGGTLGKKWVAAGHQVRFGVHDPEGKNAQALRAELGAQAVIGTVEEALQSNPDVVLVAIPGAAVESTAQAYAAQLNGRIIIDATNRMGEDSLHNLAHFQQHAPQSPLYRAFNSLGWENFADPYYDGVAADLFYCGTAGEAQAKVEHLISDLKLRPIYLGGVEQAAAIDGVTSIWFALAFGQKKGRHIAFKVLGI